jgi:two-component system NarL family response regulator
MERLIDNVPISVIRIFLLIENRLLREALVRLFRKRCDFLVVGQGEQARTRDRDVMDSKCDVLVIASFETDWRAAHLAIERVGPLGPKVLLLGMDADEEQFIAAVRSGVAGYLLKDACASDVVASVRAVFRGEAVCPPQLCITLFRYVAQIGKDKSVLSQTSRPDLTLRQQQLVGLVAKGLTNKEIASHLNLSEFTVRNHIHRILKQVDAGSRSEAVETIRAHGYSITP